jgi:hypothetical protein
VQRLDHGLGIQVLAVGQDLPQISERLLGAAQDRVLAAEDLHRHHRVDPLGREDPARALEVHVGGVAGQDVGGRLETRSRWLRPGHGRAV